MRKKDMNAIVLVRVSTEQQTLESQTEKVFAAAKSDGYANPIIIENKESAVKNDEEHLLGIVEMKQHIEEGSVECVYCSEISRLSRRPKVLYSLRDYLIEHKVQLVCLNPYFRLLDTSGKLDSTASVVFALFGSFAEQEGMLRSERCLRGRYKKRDAGLFIGGKLPMGYSRDSEDRFIIDPKTAPVVQRIYKEYVAGVPKLEIARELMAEGYLQGFENAKYAHTHIENVLRNSDYTGLRGRPQIISQKLFDAAQEKKKAPAVRRKVNRIALGQGLMFNPKSENSKKRYYVSTPAGSYYCVLDKDEMRKKYIAIEKFDAELWTWIKWMYVQQRDGKTRAQEKREQKKRINRIERRITQLEEQISTYQGKIEKVEERLIMCKISAEKADALEKKIEDEKNGAMKELETLRSQLETVNPVYEVEDIDKLSGEERVALVRRLVDRIDLIPCSWKRGDLHWRCLICWKRGDASFFHLYSGRKKTERVSRLARMNERKHI